MESKSPNVLSSDELLTRTSELREAELQSLNNQFACACSLSKAHAERIGQTTFELVITGELQKLMIEAAEIAGMQICELPGLIHEIFEEYVTRGNERSEDTRRDL